MQKICKKNMEKKWLWTNVAIISVLVILLLVLIFYNPNKKTPTPNYWATFSQVAQNNSATYEQLKEAFKSACPTFKDCTPSNSLWYVVRARGFYGVNSSEIMTKAQVKDLMGFYEKEYKNDKYQYSFIPMFPLFLGYLTKDEAYQWLNKLGSFKCNDYECHMNQAKNVFHIISMLNLSDVSDLKGKIKDYNQFINNVCWKESHPLMQPSRDLLFYLAYRSSCNLPLNTTEKQQLNTILSKKYENSEEEHYKDIIKRNLKILIGASTNTS